MSWPRTTLVALVSWATAWCPGVEFASTKPPLQAGTAIGCAPGAPGRHVQYSYPLLGAQDDVNDNKQLPQEPAPANGAAAPPAQVQQAPAPFPAPAPAPVPAPAPAATTTTAGDLIGFDDVSNPAPPGPTTAGGSVQGGATSQSAWLLGSLSTAAATSFSVFYPSCCTHLGHGNLLTTAPGE
eukprot:scaffold18445_cov21-Tisochrysis_lutea.AAC.1